MNIVRTAGGGGSGNSYKFENEHAASINPVRRPTCSMTELLRKTKFTKDEIRHLYRTFKQDCPSGEVSKSHFATVFSTLFPGGECFRYSSFLFRNIDRSNAGVIRFEDLIVTLSLLFHGSVEDRLSWAFDLYDLNKDGILTKMELSQIIASIFQLMIPVGKFNFTSVANAIEERTEELFQIWDKNGDGIVYKDDFLQHCLQDATIQSSIDVLKTDICLRL